MFRRVVRAPDVIITDQGSTGRVRADCPGLERGAGDSPVISRTAQKVGGNAVQLRLAALTHENVVIATGVEGRAAEADGDYGGDDADANTTVTARARAALTRRRAARDRSHGDAGLSRGVAHQHRVRPRSLTRGRRNKPQTKQATDESVALFQVAQLMPGLFRDQASLGVACVC